MPGANRHRRENAQRHLSKSTTERIQKSIISKMFGADGLTSEIDEVVLEAKSEQILNTIIEEAPDFSTYFTIIFTHNMCYCGFFYFKMIYYAAINAILIASVLYTVCHL